MPILEYKTGDETGRPNMDIQKIHDTMEAIEKSGAMPEQVTPPEIAGIMAGVVACYMDVKDFGSMYALSAILVDMASNEDAAKALSKDERQAIGTAVELLASVASRHSKGISMGLARA